LVEELQGWIGELAGIQYVFLMGRFRSIRRIGHHV
jgi:hypothetical protein